MKKMHFLFFLTFSGAIRAQPPLKIYAWSQEVTAGTVRKDVNEKNGNPVEYQKGEMLNYLIFAQSRVLQPANFDAIWIRGKYYKTQTYKVDSTPVVQINNDMPDNPVKKILIPATTSPVIAIVPLGSPGNFKIGASWFRKMMKDSELIVSYSYKGKKYYIGVKKIKLLPPAPGV